MTVRPRGGSFLADFMVAGTRYRETFETYDAAQDWEDDTRKALKRGLPVPSAKRAKLEERKLSLGDLFKLARGTLWDRQQGSASLVAKANVFVTWAGASKAPSVALTKASIAEFVEYLVEEREVAASTVNQYLTALAALIRVGSLSPVQMPYQKVKPTRRRFFTEAEVEEIRAKLQTWGRTDELDFFTFLVDTGARPFSEAAKLTWADIREGRFVSFDATKGGEPRVLPLTRRCQEIVQRRSMGGSKGPFQGVQPWAMTEVWADLRAVIPSLEDTVLYTARHTCASWQVIRGIDIRRVQIWMGHKSLTTTLIYANLAPSHLLDNLQALDRDVTLTTRAA